jgi:hypothetical protein
MTYYAFPDIHWQKIRTDNPLERIMREIRRRTRVVGAFPDGQSCLNLAAARLRYIAGPPGQLSARLISVRRICTLPASYRNRSCMTDIEVAEYVATLDLNRCFPNPESPRAIEELRRHNVNVRPVVKGNGSEKHGTVRELLKLHVHHQCKGLIAEFETHAYKNGKDEPVDEGEDAVDALRCR